MDTRSERPADRACNFGRKSQLRTFGCQARSVACAIFFLLSLLVAGLRGQDNGSTVSAQRAVMIHAVLPSSIHINPEASGFELGVPGDARNAGDRNAPQYSVEVEWNLEPSVRQIQLIAFFQDGSGVAVDDEGHVVNAGEVEMSFEGSDWKEFPTRIAEHRSSGLLLLSLKVSGIGRRGKRTYRFRLRLRPDARNTSHGRYSGALHFRALLQ